MIPWIAGKDLPVGIGARDASPPPTGRKIRALGKVRIVIYANQPLRSAGLLSGRGARACRLA